MRFYYQVSASILGWWRGSESSFNFVRNEQNEICLSVRWLSQNLCTTTAPTATVAHHGSSVSRDICLLLLPMTSASSRFEVSCSSFFSVINC